MKKIYLVQPNNSLSGSLFLPYSIGSIAAYSFGNPEIFNFYELGEFIFTKLPVSEALEKMDSPYLVGFSCYMWNVEYNLTLASEIKRKYPNCILIFGGPQIPNDVSYLEEYDYIDVLIHGEGEVTFFELLNALKNNEGFDKIFNISFRYNEGYIKTKHCQICDLSTLPSPYSEGYFDCIINDPKYIDMQIDAIIETNRGCPYKCIYCCWAGNKDSFREFTYERIQKDLEWISKNKISYCICADSNFGILERDENIVDYLIELKKKYGYPKKFETTAAKNKDDLVFRINKKLDSENLNRGVSVAVQSMSPKVLEIIGRNNMNVNNFSEQLEIYRKAGMYTYTDIILGLPGETFDSFSDGLFSVIEAGQHNSININRCEYLPNTIMYSDEVKSQYGIKTVKSHLCQNHSKVDIEAFYGSRSELVVETNTMSREDWRCALRLSVCVQTFHCFGLLRFLAIYLRKAKGIHYKDFYSSLFYWIENSSVFIKSELDYVCKSIDCFLAEESDLSFNDSRFGDIYWSFEEALFLCLAYRIEDFYNEINIFLSTLDYTANDVISDLYNYQKNLILLPNQNDRILSLYYDWTEYFDNTFEPSFINPEKRHIEIKLKGNNIDSWEEYARRIVWYGKREDRMINR